MPSKNYWINRANRRMDDYILQSEETANEITKAYYVASKRIEKEMVRVVQGLGAISDDRTALKYLKNPQSKSVIRTIRKAVSTMPEGPEKDEALTLISSPAYLYRMRRLQDVIDNARKECNRLYKVELKDATAHLRNLYNDAFSHTIYDIDKGYNTLHTFSMFPASRVNTLLKSEWSGANYSERIWNSTQNLADSLKEQLLISFMTGASVSKTSREISERFQVAAYNARRLVRTESNYIANQAEHDAYKRLGIEEYQFIATLDTRTSKPCRELDGRVFNVEDGKPGINMPPMHPNCRSTTIMYDADSPIKSRAARDADGNLISVPGNMTYKQWLEEYHPELVDKAGKSGIMDLRAMSAATQPLLNISEYEIKEDLEGVERLRKEISETLGIPESDIDFAGIKNTEVIEPFFKRFKLIQSQTGMTFPPIKAVEVIDGNVRTIAGYKPGENVFYISSRFFNSKKYLEDTLKKWSDNRALNPKCRNIVFLAEHEASHIRISDDILLTKEAENIWKNRKRTSENDDDIFDYFADMSAIYRMNRNTKDKKVIEVINYLNERGVKS